MVTDVAGRFGISLGGWLLVSGLTLALLGTWSPTLYFVIGTVGVILALEYSEPVTGRPKWHRRVGWVTGVLLLIFVYMAITWVETNVGVSLI